MVETIAQDLAVHALGEPKREVAGALIQFWCCWWLWLCADVLLRFAIAKGQPWPPR
jgi:hypothetical protein